MTDIKKMEQETNELLDQKIKFLEIGIKESREFVSEKSNIALQYMLKSWAILDEITKELEEHEKRLSVVEPKHKFLIKKEERIEELRKHYNTSVGCSMLLISDTKFQLSKVYEDLNSYTVTNEGNIKQIKLNDKTFNKDNKGGSNNDKD